MVIAIIALLAGLLSPALSRARLLVRITVCRSNLHQLGTAHQQYTSANKGNFFEYRNNRIFMDFLEPYHLDDDVRLCPEAPIRAASANSYNAAWWYNTSQVQRGSYGINGWIYSPTGGDVTGGGAGGRGYPCCSNRPFPDSWYTGTYAVGYPGQTPTFADCMWVDGWPWDDDFVPTHFQGIGNANEGWQMSRFLIDRHDMAINVLFADGHGELLPLSDLWLLRWSRVHKPTAMQVP